MQTKITMNLAFGKPGEHANTQPYRADAYAVASAVTLGTLAYTGTGGVGTYAGGTRETYLGLFVSPNEHVNMALPSNIATLQVPAGTTVAVAKRGSWFVAIPKIATASGTYTYTGASTAPTITAINASTFGTAVSGAKGKYTFTYDTDHWEYGGSSVNIASTYGITVSGTPADGDTIVVDFDPKGANDSNWVVGAKIYASAGDFTTTASTNPLVGEILAIQNGSNLVASGNEFGDDTADVAIINLG
jgi:hypothetical protein